MTGAEMIAAERRRQIDELGYSAGHDAGHGQRLELLRAAWCYLEAELDGQPISVAERAAEPPLMWPPGWDWKPSADPLRNLTKASALIAAEIDRQQAESTSDGGS